MKKFWNKIKEYVSEYGAAPENLFLLKSGIGLLGLSVGFLALTTVMMAILATMGPPIGIPFAVALACAGAGLLAEGAAFILPLVDSAINRITGMSKIVKNDAGQTVEGPLWALKCLRRAQINMESSVTGTFNEAGVSVKAQEKIVKAQQAVKILNAGTLGAGTDQYQFVKVNKTVELVA